jgi:biopolymer transport protein ExbB
MWSTSLELLINGGPMMLALVATSAVAIVVFIQRLLHYHREQINSTEFLIGVRNVLKRDNVVEAISICDATPGPVARMVKIAILSRDRGRDGIRDALDAAGLMEVPRLEERLNVLATIAQIAPLMGLFGTSLGFIELFRALEISGGFAGIEDLAGGIWQALICTATGLAVAIFAYAGYNYLVGRVNSIVLDMEKSSTEIQNLVVDLTNGESDEA